MDERDAAREALESIEATRRETAHRAASPRGYYALVGSGVALVTIGLGVGDPWRWPLYAIGLVTLLGAMSWYSRRTGIVTFATLREPGAWRAWLMVAVAVGGVVLALLSPTASLIAAAATVVTWSVLGPRWDADWQRSLEQQP